MSKVTAGINRINQELDKISGMDGIAADKIAEIEIASGSDLDRNL